MKRIIRSRRLLLAAAILAAVAAWPLGQAATAAPAEPTVPVALEVPDGNKLFLVGHADGVQIYECKLKDGAYKWEFVAPRADVRDESGKLLMTHFGGPTWEARDGSYAVGSSPIRHEVAGAIPWLRLSATGTAGHDGDRLAGTTFIQRLATVGGVAPAPETCSAANAGARQEVDYTADYYFWKAIGD